METVKEKLVRILDDYWEVTMTVEDVADVLIGNGVTLQDAKSLNEFLAPIDEYQGLKQKYLVFKADSGERVMDCFVLLPQKDLAAAEALRAYANATDNKVLADDIRNWIGEGEVLQDATDTNVGDEWVKTSEKESCPMRHENGNCLPAGGFCTAVNDPICDALHNAYESGRCSVATDTNDKWVSVDEWLPEESLNSVIGWDEYRERCVFVQYYKGEWVLGDHESVKITHWMPLPQPQKGDNSNE